MSQAKFMVIAFDPANLKVTYDPVLAVDKAGALQFVKRARPHCHVIDALSTDDLNRMSGELTTMELKSFHYRMACLSTAHTHTANLLCKRKCNNDD
jgi:hypothetical protein